MRYALACALTLVSFSFVDCTCGASPAPSDSGSQADSGGVSCGPATCASGQVCCTACDGTQSCAAACSGIACDSGALSDAGNKADSGSSTDSGSTSDSGIKTDSGTPIDSGSIADAGCENAPGCTAVGGNCVSIDGGSEVVTCVSMNGCLKSSGDPTVCASDQLCSSAADGGAACVCNNTCPAAGTFCADATHTNTCTADSNECLIAGTPTACPAGESCQGAAGSAACACPAVGAANTATPTGCATTGTTACDPTSGNIDICTKVGACDIWQSGSSGNCVASGLVCNTQGNNGAACQCPALPANATAVYVDSKDGSDRAAGAFPTGIQSPAQCRFGTITFALTKAPAGGSVIATGPTPMTFTQQPVGTTGNSETFPIDIPNGITLTTSDATPTPANYLISFNSGTAANAVTLGTGSTIQGFSIENAGGNAAAPALLCTAGAATINGVDLLAAAATGSTTTLAEGLAVTGTCAVSATNLSTNGFSGAGIGLISTGVSSFTGGTVTATSTAGSANTLGVGMTAGTVTFNGSTVTASTGSGIAIVNGTLTGTNLTVSDCTDVGIGIVPVDGGTPSVTLTDGTVSANGQGGTGNSGIAMAGGNLTVNGTAVTLNGQNGFSMVGGTATLGQDSQGTGASFDGNGAISGGGVGIGIEAGAVAATGIDISGNAGDGLAVIGGTTITVTGGTIGNNAAGAKYGGNKADGVLVVAGATTTVTLHGVSIAANGARGVELATTPGGTGNAATVNIDGTGNANGSLITGNGTTTNDANIRASTGTLVVCGTGQAAGLVGCITGCCASSGAANTSITGAVNGYGLNLGGGAAGATTVLNSVSITGNALSGINVHETASNPITVTGGAISNNKQDGVTVLEAPASQGGASPLQITGANIQGNASIGVNLIGTDGNVGAILTNCVISGNGSTGVVVNEPRFQVSQTAFQGNVIENNNTALATTSAIGGISFTTVNPSSNLQSFYANVIGGNGGDQIAINGSGAWTLNDSACDAAHANSIFCYASGHVGLNAISSNLGTGITVNANDNHWSNDPPIQGKDFACSGGLCVVNAGTSCAAVTSTCPPTP
jgi:hypothetical protein